MDFFEWTLIFVVIWMKVVSFSGTLFIEIKLSILQQPSHSNARFCMANQMTIYGTIASTTSATSSQDCAYQTWEAANLGFGWDGSSQCQMFSAITGYLEQADSTYTYYIQGNWCFPGFFLKTPNFRRLVFRNSVYGCGQYDFIDTHFRYLLVCFPNSPFYWFLVYDGNTCPTSFTFDPSEQVCQSTMVCSFLLCYPWQIGKVQRCLEWNGLHTIQCSLGLSLHGGRFQPVCSLSKHSKYARV